MISPTDKIQLMRMYALNPSSAILMLADLLKKDLEDSFQKSLEAKTLEIKAQYEKEMEIMLDKKVPDLVKVLDSVKGMDGEDSDPEEVAQIILDTPEFLKMAMGPKGDKGDSIRGPQGNPGRDSTVPGPAGKDGRDGRDGEDGESIIGPPGKDGKDGSPDKPEQIARKLNKTEESVNISVIKGLPAFMRNVQNALREKKGKAKLKGGGMSLLAGSNITITRTTGGRYTITSSGGAGGSLVPQIVSGTINGSNTTFTIGAAISGKSFIVLNGATQIENVDYTLSGTTITYTVAPPSSGGNDTHYLYAGGGSLTAPTVTYGTGAPSSTPSAIGDTYVDTSTGNIYMAVGTSSSADWRLLATY